MKKFFGIVLGVATTAGIALLVVNASNRGWLPASVTGKAA